MRPYAGSENITRIVLTLWLPLVLCAVFAIGLGAGGCSDSEGPTDPMDSAGGGSAAPNDTLPAPGTSVLKVTGQYYLPAGSWRASFHCGANSKVYVQGLIMCNGAIGTAGLPTLLQAQIRPPAGSVTVELTPF